MKKIWKAVILTSVILCVVGIICAAVSYFIGGSLDKLYQNESVLPVLEMLSPESLFTSILAFLGA